MSAPREQTTQGASARACTRPRPRRVGLACALACALLLPGCAGRSDRQTLAGLERLEPDLREAEIDDGIEQAMAGYRKFLEEAPTSSLTPEAMRRLADLKLEKEYGLLGGPASDAATPVRGSGEASATALPAPRAAARPGHRNASDASATGPAHATPPGESDAAFERRALEAAALGADLADPRSGDATAELPHPAGGAARADGPLEAIALYDQILATYPDYPYNDQVLYQKARAYDELGRVDEAVAVAAELVARYPESRHLDEIQFRRAEYFFTRKKFLDAEEAYADIVARGPGSDYFELALYKLGWTFYKQMMLEEALETYLTLLDHKVTTDYDFDQTEDEAVAQRVADTYRVMSLCFSDLGGAEAVTSFFATHGARRYEHRVYRQLGEFYLEKLRYSDAAAVYHAFVDLHPIHAVAPRFSMRIVEIYEAGDFPRLVLDSKKDFAVRYGVTSEYWQHFDLADADAVVDDLKQNLRDLANHYHALYQATERPEERPAHFAEGARWYRDYLASFPTAPETPGIHYQLADLMLEHRELGPAALEYERIAYDYPPHEQAAPAGYAAIFARRQQLADLAGPEDVPIREAAVESTLRFVEAFPDHAQAAIVLGAAVDDLYTLEAHARAIEVGRALVARYPDADPEIRRGAFTVVAHASFDSEDFPAAEQAYERVLELTPAEDPTRPDRVNNLAAAIYKQGELASERADHRAAADHFLRIARSAPTSTIRPVAEYDAAVALVALEDWSGAASVLEAFRAGFPEHELGREATRQMAFVYREAGDPSRAAEEYERVAAEADAPEMRAEALLVAGSLFEEAGRPERALRSYGDFVTEFTHPIERAVVTRFKMAEIHADMGADDRQRAELQRIVSIDRTAGADRTPVVRTTAARAALLLSEPEYGRFAAVELTQPFEASLRRKQQLMENTLGTFEALVDYAVSDVTAAATYYMAEIYAEFSRALLASERPGDLDPAERLDYEDVLEEEAFPFEERAIDVHEKNLELVSSGIFNEWIEKSLARLADVMPGRYAKFELSAGPLESMEQYVYRAPGADREATLLAQADAAPAEGEPARAEGEPARAEGEPAPSEGDPVPAELASEPATAGPGDAADGRSDVGAQAGIGIEEAPRGTGPAAMDPARAPAATPSDDQAARGPVEGAEITRQGEGREDDASQP